ncbi:MAG: menaquinone biosynthesis protein [bacterium]|nr:menaquinone biosynthesis protein [bacterium]
MYRIGTVSYLNALPLIDGLENEGNIEVRAAVPSRLLQLLLSSELDIALCPTIDFQLAPELLRIVPVGGIASRAETLTVRVFSKVDLANVETVRVDTDSHTSVALMEIVFAELFGRRPHILPLISEVGAKVTTPEAILLIGDKVVTTEPDAGTFPFQLDLGAAWREITGLPFVFAVWMTRPGTQLGHLPELLARLRRTNKNRIPEIVDRHAESLGWPKSLAARYLGSLLQYGIGEPEMEAIQRFWSLCADHGVISRVRPLAVHE